MANQKGVVQRDTGQVNRVFNYSLDGVALNFTLRIDVKKELKTFAELLKVALADVEEQITKVGKE